MSRGNNREIPFVRVAGGITFTTSLYLCQLSVCSKWRRQLKVFIMGEGGGGGGGGGGAGWGTRQFYASIKSFLIYQDLLHQWF